MHKHTRTHARTAQNTYADFASLDGGLEALGALVVDAAVLGDLQHGVGLVRMHPQPQVLVGDRVGVLPQAACSFFEFFI